jgi:DNA-binding response OmpR family regulator
VLNKLLLVEDDTLLGESIVDLLEEESYEVVHVVNGEEALEKMYNTKYDLYLIDINLPLLDGITLLKELRDANDTTPAIFLTSFKEKEKLKEGFLSGGDDYITKPFDNDELLLRIEALLRRTKPQTIQQIGAFTIDEQQMLISYNNEALELTKREYEILRLLLQQATQIVSKEHILDTVWGLEGGSEGAIRVYINRLKQLLPNITIENIRGIGYKLVL